MASGNALFILRASDAAPPATTPARPDIIVGTSSPAEQYPVLAFHTTTIEYADFYGLIMPPHYSGGGITITIHSSAAANTSTVQWEIAFRRIADDAEDLDTTAQTYDYNLVSFTVASAIGELSYDDITFTNGADMDNVVAGDSFNLRLRRNTGGTDAMAADAYFHTMIVKET